MTRQQGPRSEARALPQEGKDPRPQARAGRFNTLRWAMVWLTQIIFYGACWLRVGRRPPGAAVRHRPREVLPLRPGAVAAGRAAAGHRADPRRPPGCSSSPRWPGGCSAASPARRRCTPRSSCGSRRGSRATTCARLQARRQGPLDGCASWRSRRHRASACGPLVARGPAVTFVGYFTPIRELLPAIVPAGALGPWEAFWLLFYGPASPMCRPASPARRCASTCARTRASRA